MNRDTFEVSTEPLPRVCERCLHCREHDLHFWMLSRRARTHNRAGPTAGRAQPRRRAPLPFDSRPAPYYSCLPRYYHGDCP
jgi:hypothetical protein